MEVIQVLDFGNGNAIVVTADDSFNDKNKKEVTK